MAEALARTILQELVNERVPFLVRDPVEQPVALPHRATDGHLASNHVENPRRIDPDERVLCEDRRERSPALEPHFEPQVVQAEQEAVGRALRHAGAEDPCEPAADRERLIGIDEHVGQLADPFLEHAAQRPRRILGDRVPGEQRDHVRHERRRKAVPVPQHRHDPIAIA